ncbi:MAG: hypothetical protein LBE60_06465, partial [Microbacterium sp.]|uniref:hypothetical protein n=1 Tax=Microbacterium sp. TaxID=51671 RepID=UPI002822C6DD
MPSREEFRDGAASPRSLDAPERPAEFVLVDRRRQRRAVEVEVEHALGDGHRHGVAPLEQRHG